jgi:hypothetical protein
MMDKNSKPNKDKKAKPVQAAVTPAPHKPAGK